MVSKGVKKARATKRDYQKLEAALVDDVAVSEVVTAATAEKAASAAATIATFGRRESAATGDGKSDRYSLKNACWSTLVSGAIGAGASSGTVKASGRKISLICAFCNALYTTRISESEARSYSCGKPSTEAKDAKPF